MNAANQCSAYLQHIQAEHHRLNRLLAEISRQFSILNRGASEKVASERIVGGLENLLHELQSHLVEEVGGGCLDEAAARCPSLAPRTGVLMREHQQLAARLEQFIPTVKSSENAEPQWQCQFEAFAADLRAHECAENQVLQTAFGGDAADQDVEGNE